MHRSRFFFFFFVFLFFLLFSSGHISLKTKKKVFFLLLSANTKFQEYHAWIQGGGLGRPDLPRKSRHRWPTSEPSLKWPFAGVTW